MKKSIFLLIPLCLLLGLSSCKKNSSKPANAAGTLTVTVGGKAQTFNVGATAHLDNTGGVNTLGIMGLQSTGTANSLIITVSSSGPITAKSYTDADSEAQLSYTLASGAAYQDDGTGGTTSTVTIKSITSTNVQGTFSGTLMLINGTGAATQTLTNGSFNLSIK
ncbi:MAG TPA: hypothetical protein VHE59_10925 [Mucilaginibacter sp.]|nr:hypothetical protein [Mucilaginibacter sp.]